MEATLTGGSNGLSLDKMIQLQKRKKLQAVSHPSTLLTKAELNYKKILLRMCNITDMSRPQQNQT